MAADDLLVLFRAVLFFLLEVLRLADELFLLLLRLRELLRCAVLLRRPEVRRAVRAAVVLAASALLVASSAASSAVGGPMATASVLVGSSWGRGAAAGRATEGIFLRTGMMNVRSARSWAESVSSPGNAGPTGTATLPAVSGCLACDTAARRPCWPWVVRAKAARAAVSKAVRIISNPLNPKINRGAKIPIILERGKTRPE